MNVQFTNQSEAKILIVDDKPENLSLLTGMLKGKGYIIRQLRNGKRVMPSVLSDAPDLILLDIMMPETDGYKVCELLKAEEKTRDIPVIFISALYATVDKVRAFSIGGVDYITKPFEEEEVLARVETHLSLRMLQKTLEERNARLEEKNIQLEEALADVKTLSGLLPICSNCKKIRDDKGYWNQIEVYIESCSDAKFSHGICKECVEELYGDQEWYKKRRKNIIK